MVITLYLIRHGETEGGQQNRYKGHIDVPLSENGIRQMERVAEHINKSYMSHKTYNAVYCSDLSRALKSAEIIAKPHKLMPIVMPELRERNFGIWEGMTFNEIKEKYPQEFDAWVSNPLKFSPVQGESTIEVRDRVIGALGEILKNHAVQSTRNEDKKLGRWEVEKSKHHNFLSSQLQSFNNIAIVSHGGVNRIVLCHLLEIPFENIFRIEQDYGALNIVEFHDKYPVVKLINYTV